MIPYVCVAPNNNFRLSEATLMMMVMVMMMMMMMMMMVMVRHDFARLAK